MPQEEIEKYQGVYDEGYEVIRKKRYAAAIQNGVLDERWAMSRGAARWEAFEHKEWDKRCMEVYAAMVDRMDQGIGRIIDVLEKNGELDNTLVVYLQDNGGCVEGYGRASNSDKKDRFAFKPFGPDDLQTKIWPPMQTRDGRWVRTGPETMPGAEDTFVAYGLGWANVSNTPFRGYKHDGYEGGISTPFIVHWPAGVAEAQIGGVVHEPTHLIDIMPTVLQAAGGDYPDTYSGQPIQPMEGKSLLLLAGQSLNATCPRV